MYIGVPIGNKSAETIARVIVDRIFLNWGLCDEILTDQGTEFENALLRELLRIIGVAKVRTSGYKPSTNGAVEAWHEVLHSRSGESNCKFSERLESVVKLRGVLL